MGNKGENAALGKFCRNIWHGLKDLLLPDVCAGCGSVPSPDQTLCESCRISLLELISKRYCPRCGVSLGPGIETSDDGCARCPVPLPRFRRVVRLGPYRSPLRELILDIKYRGRTSMLRTLARMFTAAFENIDSEFDLIIPVPVHLFRRIVRNLDHTFLLARALGKAMSIPVSRELVRIRNTPQQSELSRSRRADNVRNAFRAKNRRLLKGANILLVDDISTTVATADESARVLLNAGVSSVTLAIIARTERKGHFS